MPANWVDFKEVKARVALADVLRRYRKSLKQSGDYLRGDCPLPMHRGSSDSFVVNVPRNLWSCHSDSCLAARNGETRGDVIGFVSFIEGCDIRTAAVKLNEWFLQPKAEVVREPVVETEPVHEVKTKGYIQDSDSWLTEILSSRRPGESDENWLKRVKNAIKSKLIESYKNGKAAA